MATVNLGRIKPVFRGAYSGSTAYVVDDIVTSGNETYICIQAHGAGTQAVTQTAYWTKLAAKGTDGTDVGTTITTQGDILYRDGSGLARLAAGTSGQVLQTGGSGANPSWGTVSSDCVKLASGTFSTSASELNIDNYFNDTTYNHYKLNFSTQNTGHSGNTIRFRWRNSGSALTSSQYYYASNIVYQPNGATTHNQTGGWGSDHVAISHLGNDNNERTIGEITMFSPTVGAGYPQILYHSYAKDGTSQFACWNGGSTYNGALTVDGCQLYTASGNWTQTGFWSLHGFKK